MIIAIKPVRLIETINQDKVKAAIIMYLEHFNFNQFPFALTPNTEFYCKLSHHQAALNVILVSLRNGEGFIKIIGEVGTGKTLLCRELLNQLDKDSNDFITAYILNPHITPAGLRRALAQELGLTPPDHLDSQNLIDLLHQKLVELHSGGKKVVLLIDEAQGLSTESLEAIRLLTNFETEKTKLLQVVLFGQPELEDRLSQENLRQLQQRISFAYMLKPLSRTDLDTYLYHRLAMVGFTHGRLFTRRAMEKLYQASQGIPRVINILSHKSLMVAYGRGEKKVDHTAVIAATSDSPTLVKTTYPPSHRAFYFAYGIAAVAGIALAQLLAVKMSL